ncbi:MAG TPA: HAD hydrolase-like protein, partial [Dehalococcoidia bacterium]|nr:HAD hydrolase-like protein [Dehalococcoidia bacterium]
MEPDLCGVIFDLDGVITDSSAFHFEAWRRLGAELGVPVTEAFFRETFGQHNRQIIPQLLGRPVPPEELQRLAERKEALFRAVARGHIRPLPGAVELVHRLRADDRYRLALASSTPRENIDLILGELGLFSSFAAIVSAE